MKFTTNFVRNHEPLIDKEVNEMPSETIQGESYTIKELYSKMLAGSLPPIQRRAEFTGESFDFTLLPKYKQNFDLTDLEEARQRAEYILKTVEPAKEKGRAEDTWREKAQVLLDDYESKKAELESLIKEAKTTN